MCLSTNSYNIDTVVYLTTTEAKGFYVLSILKQIQILYRFEPSDRVRACTNIRMRLVIVFLLCIVLVYMNHTISL